ncbi:MAG TPA: dienelactone hydrolase family protein [Pyrinomonadaceae bacterium]|nr:dienelactone hydrolase family protein [Pyrinomonadaceae bacterium]
MCLGDDCNNEKGTDRRTFLTGAAAAALVGLTALEYDAQTLPTRDQIVTRVLDDPNVQHGKVVFKHGGKETIDGYLARPKAAGVFPAVIVIAGNVITEEYIPNTCAALAAAGFVGLAPNIFHILPDNARTPEERRLANLAHTDADALQDIQAGIDYLRTQPFVKNGGVGVVGFCYGGKLAMMLGSRSREIDAVVPFHPGPTSAAEISRVKSPVQIHSGTADRHVPVASVREIEKTLKAQGAPTEVFLYEGADHGFLAYTRPYYKPDAAKLAWTRTVEFLRRHLK